MSMHKTRPTESNVEMNLDTSVVCRNRGRNSTLQTSKHVRFPLLPHTLSALQAAGRWWGAVDVYSWVARLYGVFNLFLFSISLTVHWRGKMQRWRNCLSLWCLKSAFNICLFFYVFCFTIVTDIRLIRVAIVMEMQWKNTAVGEVKNISHSTE